MAQLLNKTVRRSEVPLEQTWNLEDLFSSSYEWESELVAVKEDLKLLKVFKGRVIENAATLLACMNKKDALTERLGKILAYASLKQSEDGTNPENQANSSRVGGVYSLFNKETSFIQSEILQLDEEKLKLFLADEPELQDFQKVILDVIVTKPHKLSPDAEEILSAFSEVHQAPYMIYQRSLISDLSFPSFQTDDGESHHLTFNTFPNYEGSPNTDLRRKAYKAYTEKLSQYKHTYAATYATEVKKQVIESRLRNFDTVTDMLLHSQQVTKEMYHNQLDIIQKELAPHMRKLAKLKQRVLGLDTMKYCDLKAPLDPEFNPSTTYEEASKIILKSLEVMGPEYIAIMEEGLNNRWVDMADNVGKGSGAFCSSPYGVHPYILMTWSDSMRNAYTLAHELGHAGHFRLAGRYQRISSTRPSRYFVEAPSTMNEMLLSQHLLSMPNDKRMRRWIILQSLGTYYHNFVTHILEAELQRRIYKLADEDTPITAKLLCEEKTSVLSDFWGDSVELDEGAGLTWMRQPHYYMGLYPYTYSAGLTASTAAAKQIQEEGEPAVQRWLEALKAGSTLQPLELMQLAGVDMSTPEPIKTAVAHVGSLIDELEELFH